jgi:hypothetical protein
LAFYVHIAVRLLPLKRKWRIMTDLRQKCPVIKASGLVGDSSFENAVKTDFNNMLHLGFGDKIVCLEIQRFFFIRYCCP